jgi:hypothetical protein
VIDARLRLFAVAALRIPSGATDASARSIRGRNAALAPCRIAARALQRIRRR